jgi:hypothetical protein
MRFYTFLPAWIGIVALPAALVACGSSGGGGSSGSASGSSGVVMNPSYKTDIFPALQNSCGIGSSCHGDSSGTRVFFGCDAMKNPSSCTADSAMAMKVYATLTKMSVEAPTMAYVKPTDPAHSFLQHKIENTQQSDMCIPVAMDPLVQNATGEPTPIQPCGTGMPLATPFVALPDLIANMRTWIMQGAMNN